MSSRRAAGIAAAVAALVVPSTAHADLLFPGQVADARLAAGAGSPTVGIVVGSEVRLLTRGANGWSSSTLTFASSPALDGLVRLPSGRIAVLARGRDGSWLTLWDGRRRRELRRDSKEARFGPAGLTLDKAGRPVVAYALWYPSRRTFLRLARIGADGKLRVGRITREGFPPSPVPAAAMPVRLGSGEIRVVETYVPAGIEWRLERGAWWGRLLHSSALGFPTGRIFAAAGGSTVYAAWTEAFPTLGPPAIVLATRGDRVQSGVVLEDATLAGLALGPAGPELAANRCLTAASFGVEGNGVCGGLVNGVGVDGIVADYAASGATRQLLLQLPDGLYWFSTPSPLPVRVTFDASFMGRVDGAAGGTVAIYRERPNEPRALFTTVPLAADGTFAVPAPLTPVAAAYRAVYVGPATGIPYAALIRA
jgi:hypothetical protein